MILSSILKHWRFILGGLVLAGVFGAGWWLRPLPPPVTIERERLRQEIVEKIRIVEKKPDGTIIERIEERKIDQRKDTDSVRPTPQIARIQAGKYSLGIQGHIPTKYPGDLSRMTYTALLGYRPMEKLPVWTEMGYNWKRQEITLGFRIEF